MERIMLVIPISPVTKKNSGRIVKRGARPMLIPSAAYENYERNCGRYLIRYKDAPISEPVEITCRFYMKTHRKVDLVNLLNAIDDILVHYGVLMDDNSEIIVSHDGSRVYYDKDNPRTEIDIHEFKT